MTTFPIEDTELYSDDTFTLAFGSPDAESEESTPETLARAFAPQSLEELRDSLNLQDPSRYSSEIDKLNKAIGIKYPAVPETITYRANGDDAEGVTRTERLADIAAECADFCADNIGQGMDHSPAAIWEGYMSAPGDAVEVPPMPESFPALYMAEIARLALPDCEHGRKAWESCNDCMEATL